MHADVDACDCTHCLFQKIVCFKSGLWEKYPLPHVESELHPAFQSLSLFHLSYPISHCYEEEESRYCSSSSLHSVVKKKNMDIVLPLLLQCCEGEEHRYCSSSSLHTVVKKNYMDIVLLYSVVKKMDMHVALQSWAFWGCFLLLFILFFKDGRKKKTKTNNVHAEDPTSTETWCPGKNLTYKRN